MKIIGIICEYNPLHAGHLQQIRRIRREYPGCAVVCLMSGNFVQRGHPAIFHKSLRAKAALLAGADLVLELPATCALSSAEGFAAGGVSILGSFCHYLCFGSESADPQALMAAARALLAPDFPAKLRIHLDQGLSFPAARAAALGPMGAVLEQPNDILAVEYCKAIFSQGCAMEAMPIHRPGSYHDPVLDLQNPSATAVRRRLLEGASAAECIPFPEVYENAPMHTLAYGEQAMLCRLRTMTDGEFEALPFGSEGLWRKLMHASRSCATLEQILTATKSKRYTRTRLDRMAMCACLGISREILDTPAPYARVLAFRDTGRAVLKQARQHLWLPNIGEKTGHEYELLERRWDDLYGLFAREPEAPGQTDKHRVVYLP